MNATIRNAFLATTLLLACHSTSVLATTGKPILLTTPNSTRAVAFEAVSFTPEPFTSRASSLIYGTDRTTRIILFALNLSLQSDNDAAAMTANAEDANHRQYELTVEYAGKVQGLPWLTMVIVRLDESMGDLGDVLVQTKYGGVAGNRVRIAIGHVGGGPPDDPGAMPTPAPPYLLKGQVTLGGAPFGGVTVRLSGAATAETTTNNNGAYSFTIPAVGDYTITPAQKFFTFTPVQTQFIDLASTQTVNFIAVRDTFVVNGTVRDDQGNGVNGVSVKLERSGVPPISFVTSNGGGFSFANMPAGYAYTITPQDTSLFAFSSQTIAELDRNVSLNFNGILRTYSISGVIRDPQQHGVNGVAVQLSGAATATTTTDVNGSYSFTNLLAGRNYTVTGTKRFFTITPGNIQVTNLSNPVSVSFTAVRDTWTISGTVKNDEGQALDGVVVSLESTESGSSTRTVSTSNGGAFSFAGVPAGFNYSIRPTNTSVFAFTQQTVNELSQNVTINFNGVRRTYTISGVIRDPQQHGVNGVTVQLSGAATATTTTDVNGSYSFTNLLAGRNYTVTGTKRFFTLTPANIQVTNLSNPVSVSFTAVRDIWTISGTVKNDEGQALDGVVVSLESTESGSSTRTVSTSNGGAFSFAGVPAGFNYSIRPTNTSVFAFTQQTVNELSQNVTINFNGVRRTYTISGLIRDPQQHGVNGVAVQLSGAATATTTTDANGNYSFTNLLAGRNYTVTGAKRFFTITPANIQVTNLSNPVSVSFTAVRDTWTISGTVKNDEGQALDGVVVSLESTESGSSTRTVSTSNGGAFSFAGVPAGFNYSIRPTNTSVFAFTQQTVNELSQNVTINFNGVRRTYTISGLIRDPQQLGVNGVAVQLSGAATATTTTDVNGNYSFTNLLAGRNYAVTANKIDHFVNPISKSFTLLRDERADFSAIRFYIISGRVADNNGRSLSGILMSLTGPESSSARTGADGLFSFIVTTSGNYLLTPSREQEFYQFSPADQTLLNLSDHRTISFSAAVVVTSPTYVLEFDGTPMAADYGVFWPTNTNVGQFFWELWAMPSTDNLARYMISDGYGGAHTILFGFNSGASGRYALMGNVWTGASGTFYFSSDDGPSVGEWGHFAVGWDGNSIITYYDGVPVGKQAFTGPRVSTGAQDGANKLFVGGSSHQNFNGRIAQVRGFEEDNPRAAAPESAFAPQTIFSVDGQFLSYYFRPNPVAVDLSFGYNGKQHDGWLRSMRNYFSGCPGCPVPKYVIDPTAPDFANTDNPGQTNTLIAQPGTPPDGARIFDSFSRNNSTYILNGQGGLGASETGSGVWQTNVDANLPQPFGILAGRAVVLANTEALTWIPITTTTGYVDVRVERKPGAFGSGANTGICFRVVDKDNFFFAYTGNDAANSSGPKKLTLGHYQSGLRTVLIDDVAMPATWTTLRVVTSGSGEITIYADATLVYSTGNALNSFAGGAGLFNQGPGMALQNRWDNFTILDVP